MTAYRLRPTTQYRLLSDQLLRPLLLTLKAKRLETHCTNAHTIRARNTPRPARLNLRGRRVTDSYGRQRHCDSSKTQTCR